MFARHKIDFCCRGGRPLAEAAEQARVAVPQIVEEIALLVREPDAIDWTTQPTAALIEHILVTHHRPLDEELPRLAGLAQKVARVHGGPMNEAVLGLYQALVDDLLPHMQKEERILFPMMLAGHPHASAPIRVMLAEHDDVGRILHDLRAVTDDYALPPEACGSWRALWSGLAALEADLHVHIHLENNLLFPRW
ncbi:MAG: iron-sulfur cluster repair di-iron protein [Deltaproteobacteria bacterium]|nr:iron-sulfur cluster repair di-iron protein [Deltaproteobacteria bacterium]